MAARNLSMRTFPLASLWPAYLDIVLAPGLAWQRLMLESYHSLMSPHAGTRRPSPRRASPATGFRQGTNALTRNVIEAEPVGVDVTLKALPALPALPLTWVEHLPEVGDSASTTRTFHREDVLRFAHLSGDLNPLHVDPQGWLGTPFTGNLVHGAFTASLFSQVMAMQLPGPGAVYLNQTLKFQAPVYVGETVTATVTVTHVRTDKRIVTLETRADVTRDGVPVTVLEGEAVIKLLKRTAKHDDTN